MALALLAGPPLPRVPHDRGAAALRGADRDRRLVGLRRRGLRRPARRAASARSRRPCVDWSTDAVMWKRRASIIAQVRRKRETDFALLTDCIEPNRGDREFFIRKAIGWALRAYAWVEPDESCATARTTAEPPARGVDVLFYWFCLSPLFDAPLPPLSPLISPPSPLPPTLLTPPSLSPTLPLPPPPLPPPPPPPPPEPERVEAVRRRRAIEWPYAPGGHCGGALGRPPPTAGSAPRSAGSARAASRCARTRSWAAAPSSSSAASTSAAWVFGDAFSITCATSRRRR